MSTVCPEHDQIFENILDLDKRIHDDCCAMIAEKVNWAMDDMRLRRERQQEKMKREEEQMRGERAEGRDNDDLALV